MTTAREELKERMERAFAVCDRQIQRIEEALSDLGMTMPMSVEEQTGLTREQIRCIDQFISLLENDAVAAIIELIRQYDTLRDFYGRLRDAVRGVEMLKNM